MSIIYDDISKIVNTSIEKRGDAKILTATLIDNTPRFRVEAFDQPLPTAAVIVPDMFNLISEFQIGENTGTVLINPLNVGDKVYMLTCNSGQVYVVLGRVK